MLTGTSIAPFFAIMDIRNNRLTIYDILDQYGYSDWTVFERGKLMPKSLEALYVLFNFKERRKTEVSIPNVWLDDPRRHNVVAELIISAIGNSSHSTVQT
jgi:hypothetical protein